MTPLFRIGHGYDVHPLVKGRPLILGGVFIAHEFGLDGHSDADVLSHALGDALLGAAGLGDLGTHFPDSDPAYRGLSSLLLLERIAAQIRAEGYEIGNIDLTVVAQEPKLAPFRMRDHLAGALGCPRERINLKATTTEGLGFAGRREGIAAHAVALLVKNP